MSYMVDKPPSEDPIMQRGLRAWEPTEHRPVLSMSNSAFKTYNTYVCGGGNGGEDGGANALCVIGRRISTRRGSRRLHRDESVVRVCEGV